MGKSIRNKVSLKIKTLRKKHKLTQEKLAELSGIDYKYIQRIEGKNPPNLKIETIARLAKILDIPASKLLED